MGTKRAARKVPLMETSSHFWLWLGYGLTLIAIPHLLLRRKRPAATVAWLWALLLFPYVGVLFYWMAGTERLQRRRLKRQAAYRKGSAARAIEEIAFEDAALTEREKEWLRMLGRMQEIPFALAAEARLLINAGSFYQRLQESISSAESSIHIQFYIWRNDAVGAEFLRLLVKAARRGVKVRVLLDELGCLGLSGKHFRPLLEAGGEFSWFLTLNPWRNRFFFNLRNHRKLQVIDGKTAFVGGMNIGVEYPGSGVNSPGWEDLQIELSGPVVGRLQEQFEEDWYFATEKRIPKAEAHPPIKEKGMLPCQVVEGGPDSGHMRMECSLLSLFNQSQERLWLSTGYFVPNSVLLAGIKMAAWRGVDVRLLIAGKSDQPYLINVGRSYYEELLEAGVKIYEYEKGIVHTKAALLDEAWIFAGSSNTDNRSMRLNFELNVLLKAPEQAKELEALFKRYFQGSGQVTREAHLRRPFRTRLIEAAYRPLAPLL
jgi:cardiolipin synthase